MDNTDHNLNHLEYNNIDKAYEKYYYRPTSMSCKIKYADQPETERIYYKPKRKENIASTELDPEKVKDSYYANKVSNTGKIG